MRTSISYSIIMALICLLSACTTSKSTVSQNTNLSKYEYVSILNNDTYHIPAKLMEYEIQLFDAVEGSGLQLVSDWRISELSQQHQSKLLLCRYAVDIYDEETIVTVNFIDYMSGRPIASCRGASTSLGISSAMDIKNAINNVAKQIRETFSK